MCETFACLLTQIRRNKEAVRAYSSSSSSSRRPQQEEGMADRVITVAGAKESSEFFFKKRPIAQLWRRNNKVSVDLKTLHNN